MHEKNTGVQAVKNGTHIESLTDLLKDLSDLTLDVLTYRIIRRFARASPANRYAIRLALLGLQDCVHLDDQPHMYAATCINLWR